MTQQEKTQFVLQGFTTCVQAAPASVTARWGKMSLHQMIEHAADFFDVSSGKLQFPLVTPEAHLPRVVEFLLSEKPFRENTKAPESVLGTDPLPLRSASPEAALQRLEKSIHAFSSFFASQPGATTIHPVFGALNYEHWILLHFKHLQHHARQFDLL